MTPGPAVRTASALPRNSPVPIAPPMAIMPSWPAVSWRESCSPCSTPAVTGSAVFIRGGGTPRRVEHTQQPDRIRAGVLDTVHDADREVHTAPRTKLRRRRLAFDVQDGPSLEDANPLFVHMPVERSLARGDPPDELGHLLAPHVGVHEQPELTVAPRAHGLAIRLLHHAVGRRAALGD